MNQKITITIENANQATLAALAAIPASAPAGSFEDFVGVLMGKGFRKATAEEVADIEAAIGAGSGDAPVPAAAADPAPAAADPAPAAAAAPAAPAPAPRRITSSRLSDLHVGDDVSWSGAKFRFDGVVEKLVSGADKVVYLRPNGTGMELRDGVWANRAMTKRVSLTPDDLDAYNLTKLAA